MNRPHVILDTNILISYALKPSATITETVQRTLHHCTLLTSQDTFDELRHVMERFVRRHYVTLQEATEFLGSIVEMAEWVKILEDVEACRDPKDDKFLALAINGKAEYLVTGDKDLLTLHPFRHTRILTPKDFVAVLDF